MKIKEKADEYEENWNFSRVSLSQAFEDGADYALETLKEEIENKIKILKKQENHSNIYNYDKDCINAIISYLEGVLSHIPKSKDAKDD